ncbi:MAG: bifunctional oligoribonuclease/PAP phosphatase NrnA [Desulforhopalus sp.]|nr:bifunctional oligoribonuclease/PAP phosphatase NrnA [Desulforhopalus sp.]
MNENPERTIPERLIAEIQGAKNIVLLTHSHPDGDALGSLFALAGILDTLGKNVFCFLEEPVSHHYDFLPDTQRANTNIEDFRKFVGDSGTDILMIGLDCGDDDRLGRLKAEFLRIEPFLVIDHHRSHRAFGTISWVDPCRSSTGEMIFELAQVLQAPITYNCAYNLYVAICTDSGSFRYECTTPRTMQIAAELLEKGVRPEEVGSHLYDKYSVERLRLMQMVLATISLCAEDRIAFMHVSNEMLEQSGATIQDVEGFVDLPRSLLSVKVAVLIKETGNGVVAVSMRAKGECDVALVAKEFDGGGHRNAAGFRTQGKTIEQVQQDVHKALCRILA